MFAATVKWLLCLPQRRKERKEVLSFQIHDFVIVRDIGLLWQRKSNYSW